MKIMIDTNIFISAALTPSGNAAKAFVKAMLPPYEPIVCDYIVDELHRKFREKVSEAYHRTGSFSVSCASGDPYRTDAGRGTVRGRKNKLLDSQAPTSPMYATRQH